MFFSRALLLLSLCIPLFAQEMAIERLQSVVDEVSELRMRYAASVQKNEECEAQNEAIKKRFIGKETESHAQEKEGVEQYLQGLQKRNKKLQAENKYLKYKTKEGVQAKRDAESAVSVLKKENNHLSRALSEAKQNLLLLQKSCKIKQSESVCPDENPFPKLLMREEKQDAE
jgi:prefoldin subunit 5